MYQLNWKKEPLDTRDFQVSRHRAVTVLPSSFELPIPLPVYDQADIGSCTANSGSLAYKYECAQDNYIFEPSRLQLYYNTRLLEGTVAEDSGCYIRDVFKTLAKKGICSESIWPYITEQFTVKPPTKATTDAKRHKAIVYAKVPQTLTDIQTVLVSGAIISFGFTVYESFMKSGWVKSGRMPLPRSGEKILGGHAVSIIGYDNTKQAVLIQNSWSEDWGIKGKFWMPYSFLLSSDCDDFWCIDKVVNK